MSDLRRRDGKNAFLVKQHGFHHFHDGGARRIVRAARFKIVDDFRTTLTGALHNFVEGSS